MRRLLWVGLVVAVSFGAFAGEVRGKALFSGDLENPDQPVVVYLEGGKEVPPSDGKEPPLLSQKNAQFSPQLLVVTAGQTVVMPNDDAIAHNVFSYSEVKRFNLGIYAKGDSREVRFDKPGRVDIYCSIHRHMHGVVLVVPTPYFAQTSPGKEFELKEIPEGKYTLVTWMDGAEESRSAIVVTKDGVETVEVTLKPGKPDGKAPQNE